MAGTRRTRRARRFSVALVSAATATATALTVGVEPPPAPAKRIAAENVDLTAAIQLLPTHDQVPDITGGLGTTIYDFNQAIADQLIRALVNGVNFSAVAGAAGVDPQNILTTLLADIPSNLLPGIIANLGLSLPVLGPVLQGLDLGVVTQILDGLGVDEISDNALTGLLAVIGLQLSDPLNLGGLAVPGLNIITAGPTFTALKLLGLDLGWVPSLPNSVANEINHSPYLEVGINGINGILGSILGNLPAGTTLNDVLGQVIGLVDAIGNGAIAGIPDLIHARVTPTIGIGLGAFAAAMAYEKVIADLKNQPGGSAYPGTQPILGSLTILPLVLINNPARPDGGFLARFGSLAALFGINTVNPTTHATSENGLPLGGTGLSLGGANVLPILVDATYEYQPLSDFASWPNAFTLVNNLAAGLSPTYLLRGLSLDGLADQIGGQLGNVSLNPISLNLYLTLHSKTLPTLEPLYLASDFLNIVGLSPLAQVPMRIANALAPALRILTDVGYANTVRNPDGTYTRNFATAGTEVPFLSFPRLDPGLVLSDTINALIGGIQKELGPNPTPNTPNVLANLLSAIFGGGLGGLLPSTASTTTALSTALPTTSASDLPATNARLLSLSSGADTSVSSGATDEKDPGTTESAKDQTTPADDGAAKGEAGADDAAGAPTPAAGGETTQAAGEDGIKAGDQAGDEADDQAGGQAGEEAGDEAGDQDTTPPRHAKPHSSSAPAGDQSTPPKHAKPDDDTDKGSDGDSATGGKRDVTSDTGSGKHRKPTVDQTRDTANDFSPRGTDRGAKRAENRDKGAAATAGADTGSASGGASSAAA